jgi:2-aminoadipate transaminase
VASQGSRTFNFGAGNPDPDVFPADDLAAAASRAILQHGRMLAQYPEARGIPALREVAQQRFERNNRVRPPLDDIVITNGAMQGLQLSAQGLAKPGDCVILEEFEYVGTIRVFKQYGLELVPVPLDDEGMRMDALQEVLERQIRIGRKPAFIYTTSTYQNPTGTTLPLARRQQLVEIGRRFEITIVEDDTYSDMNFEPLTTPSVYSLAAPGEVLYIGSFSKILGPGVRLGFFVAPEAMQTRLMPFKTDGGTSALSQLIAAEYFRTGSNLWDHIDEGRLAVKDKRNALLDALETEFGGIDEMHWSRPEGGLFMWVRMPERVDRMRMWQAAADRGLTYHLGQSFHALGQDVPYLRLAFGWIEKEDIADGVHLLAELMRESVPAGVKI